MKRYILAMLLISSLCVVIPVYGYSVTAANNTQDMMWHIGDQITPGDSVIYEICDYRHPTPHDVGCYQIQMDFHVKLASMNKSVWIVQAAITKNNLTQNHIFLIDSDMLKITTDYTGGYYADSIKETVLYLAKYASGWAPKYLHVGERWGIIESSFGYNIGLVVSYKDIIEIANGEILDVYTIQYRLWDPSTFTISKDLPFPITAIVYSPYQQTSEPVLAFTFELLDYTRIGYMHKE